MRCSCRRCGRMNTSHFLSVRAVVMIVVMSIMVIKSEVKL